MSLGDHKDQSPKTTAHEHKNWSILKNRSRHYHPEDQPPSSSTTTSQNNQP